MADAAAVRGNVAAEGLAPCTEADIRGQLDRILSSLEFDVSARARKFFSYVVEETLVGRADRIKAYSIAVEVFGRDTSFDAQTDPSVRIEAARIRRALERYYFTAGRDDPIVITMPKGGYVPVFNRLEREPQVEEAAAALADQPVAPTRPKISLAVWCSLAIPIVIVALTTGYRLLASEIRQESPTVSATNAQSVKPDLPGLLVEPFEGLSGTTGSAIVARGLADEVVGQIAKFKDIVVVVGGTEGTSAPRGSQPVRYVLQGSIRIEDDKLRVTARLVDRPGGSVVWADSYDKSLKVHELLETETDIARKVATAIAQPYGIIFRTDAARSVERPPDDWEAYACTLAYYAYRADLRPETHQSVKQCLERAAERFPNYATAWALLSLTYLDEQRFRYRINADSTPPLDRALDAARRAVDLDPDNVRGLQAEMTALFFHGDVDEALKIGAQAVSINPNDTELVGEYGIRLAMSGQWKRGSELILEVLDRNPGPMGYFETALAFSSYMQRDYRSAAMWIRKANVQANPLYHGIAAAIFGQLGETADAAVERDWLVRNAPQLLREVGQELATRNIPPGDQAHFVDGLRKAGILVPGF
ncbi:hypothetical protein SAZ10_14000 [Mesorhizobium sp. BAC0120]|uniref:hypothetical protein n=1 Tax=Mesorhizobium sp. BAC0120 TaxID=3090670 RepID=UPI00298D5216|nr:hypothetical protein [Mesorhizobium sp. BAC0120]MDW6022873.1 hypothetical protein [Mesorhizobium sp. BAC0120]